MGAKSNAEFLILLTSSKLGQVGFTECDGGRSQRSVEEVPDPFKDETSNVVGTKKYSPLTLRVPYDSKKHDDFIQKLENYCHGEGDDIQVSIQPIKVCPDQTPDGKARVYSGCIPSETGFPGVQRGTTGGATLEVVLHPKRMKFS